jgi:hypothetical protein
VRGSGLQYETTEMAENRIRKKAEEPEEENDGVSGEAEERRPRSRKSSRRFFRMMNVFGMFDRDQVVHAMPFIGFVTLLTIGYIANSYYAERVIREIGKTKKDIRELNAEYISTSSELMYRSRPSEVAKAVKGMGLKEPVEPPGKIVINQTPEEKR